MSEKAQIGVALAIMVVALAVVGWSALGGAEPAPDPAAAVAAPTPDRKAARRAHEEAQRAEKIAHEALREEFVRARASTDWQAAYAAAERGVERFPDPSSEWGGYWLKQRNHISRLVSASPD